MRKVILAMHTTLDGYVSGPHDDTGWIQPDDEETWSEFSTMLDQVDLLILGGGMWDEYRNYWQKVLYEEGHPESEKAYARFAEKTPHIVFSSTKKEANWPSATVEPGDVVATIKDLKARPGKNIYLVGGAEFARNMIDASMVDEYRLWINPYVLAKGKSIYHNLENRHELQRQDVKVYKNGVVLLVYTASRL